MASIAPTIDFRPGPGTAPTLQQTDPPPEMNRELAIPGYQVLGELGRGGMGVVYRARQLALGRTVALKVILGADHAGPDQLARFRAEAMAAARLQHPNIVQVFEVGEHRGLPYFSLELVSGGSLADRLKGEPQAPRFAAEIVGTLARAVHHAHERGIVHRDLKPGNVLMGEVGDHATGAPSTVHAGAVAPPKKATRSIPKVTDFGLAKQQDSGSHLTASGAVLGTPSYMAPEQAAGRGAQAGPVADVYSLGAILYEMLTGRPPFRGSTVVETLMMVMADDPVPPSRLVPRIPKDLETICLKCLAKEPHRRYASAAELADDLDRYLKGEVIHARSVSAPVKAIKWAKRHPAMATIGLILAVPLPIMLAVMFFLWRDAYSAKLAVEAEKRTVETSHREANRERELAQGYLKNALLAMDHLLDRMADDRFAQTPALRAERNAILAETTTFFETLLRLDSSDPKVRHEAAQLYARVGRIHLLSGQIDKASQALGDCVKLLESLVADFPDRLEYRVDLARARLFSGHSSVLMGDFSTGIQTYQAATEHACQLSAENPTVTEYRALEAECRRSLGYFHMFNDPSRSTQEFEQALRVAEQVVAEADTADNRAVLASVCGAYGQALVSARKYPEAEKLLLRGKDLIDTSKYPAPKVGLARLTFDQAVVANRTALAQLYVSTNRTELAEPILKELVRSLESLLAGQPQSFPYRQQAVTAQMMMASLLERRKDYEGAITAAGKAIQLIDGITADYPAFRDPQRGGWLVSLRSQATVMRSAGLQRLGKFAEALSTIRPLANKGSVRGIPAYNIACVYAVACGKAEGAEREDLAKKAMEWLRTASSTGYPSNAQTLQRVQDDPDLIALRARPEFVEWVNSLKVKK